MRKFFIILTLSVGILSFVVLTTSAKNLSLGCSATDSDGGYYTSMSYIGFPFYEGETITYQANLPAAGGATSITLEVNSVVVDTDGLPGEVSYTFPSDGTYSIRGGSQNKVTWSVSCGDTELSSDNENSEDDGDPQPLFTDGRINNYNGYAPIVVFPYEDDNGVGFDVYTDEGNLALRVTAEQIALVPAENAVIASNEEFEIVVYRLTSGEFQIMATTASGKTYVLIFSEPYPNTGYISYEE